MDWLRRARADSASTASSDPSLEDGRGGTSVSDDCTRWVHAHGCVASKDQNGGPVHCCGSPGHCRSCDGLRECSKGYADEEMCRVDEIVCGGLSNGGGDGMVEEEGSPSTGSSSNGSNGKMQTNSGEEAAESVAGSGGGAEDDNDHSDDSSDGDGSIVYDPKKRWVRASQGKVKASRTVSEFADDDSCLTGDSDRESAEGYHPDENINRVGEQDAAYSNGEVSSQHCSMSGHGNATNSKERSIGGQVSISRFPVLRPYELIRKESILKRLPSAIRHRILTLLLRSPVPIAPSEINSIHHPSHRIHASILQTCHQFHDEGKTILYHENTFRFPTHTSLIHWLLHPTTTFHPTTSLSSSHHQIRHIELTAYAFVWFTASLSPGGPPPHLAWNQSFHSSSWPFKPEMQKVIWDLSNIESLTIDFWVTERKWDEIFGAFLPESGLHVLRRSGFRPREVRVRTHGEMFEFTAREIVRALMEGGEGRRWIA